eukprot:scaffold149616_cov22-Tisochrysis_lutea.AAC.2
MHAAGLVLGKPAQCRAAEVGTTQRLIKLPVSLSLYSVHTSWLLHTASTSCVENTADICKVEVPAPQLKASVRSKGPHGSSFQLCPLNQPPVMPARVTAALPVRHHTHVHEHAPHACWAQHSMPPAAQLVAAAASAASSAAASPAVAAAAACTAAVAEVYAHAAPSAAGHGPCQTRLLEGKKGSGCAWEGRQVDCEGGPGSRARVERRGGQLDS